MGSRAPFSSPASNGKRASSHRRLAQGEDSNNNSQDVDSLRKKFFPGAAPSDGPAEPDTPDSNSASAGETSGQQDADFNALDLVNPISLGRQARRLIDDQGVPVDNVNPIALGRQARRAFDDVWTQLSQLTSPTKRTVFDDVELDAMNEAVQAPGTTVLVLGATGQVGRILVRKLLLRGYKVRALVRRKPGRGDGTSPPSSTGEVVEGIPAAVKVVFGDVGEMRDCQEAVRGAQKVIYCAAARSTFTGDLSRVEELGVRNIVKAFQDECIRRSDKTRRSPGSKRRLYTDKSKKELADFSQAYHQARWDITFLGLSEEDSASLSERSREMAKYNQAVAEISDEENLVFEGVLYQRGAAAEVGADIVALMPGGDHRTAQTEGVVLRLRGDGKQYSCIVRTDDGRRYAARFPTRAGYTHIRLPWDVFRPEVAGSPPLQPERLTYLGIRYDVKRFAARLGGGRGMPTPEEIEEMKKERQFQLEVDWIKALPGGMEPDFILVSRAGKTYATQTPNSDSEGEELASQPAPQPVPALAAAAVGSTPAAPASRDALKVVEFKRKGEDTLRLSGLGYTIIRPGGLVEEPGGYKAIVFDQGDRVTESISTADVADICLRALHEPAARNKTFDVCYEAQTEAGSEMYELVAHVPDRSNSYLKTAVSGLVKNT